MPDWKPEIRQRLAEANLEPARESAIVEELAQFMDDCYGESFASGANETEAYQQTLAELDGSELLARELRRAERRISPEPIVLGTNRRTNMIADLWLDLRYAARGLHRHALLSTVVVVTLTLSIGISAGVFTMINAIALRAAVDKDPGTFVRVYSPDLSDPAHSGLMRALTVADYLAFGAGLRSLRDVTAWRMSGPSFEDDPADVSVVLTTENYFSLYTSKQPLLGRFFLPTDFAAANPIAVLSERLWRDRLASDPKIIGKAVHFNHQLVTVIGIAPSFANNYQGTAAWLPYKLQSYLKLGDDLVTDPDRGVWETIDGRLNPGFSRQDAAAELVLLNSQQDRLHPGRKSTIILTDGSMAQRPDLRKQMIWVVFLIIGTLTLVVVIACANVTTLLLSRAHARQQEIAVRLAVGAGKLRLFRMLLAETLLLAAIAGMASVYFAYLIPDILKLWLMATPFEWSLRPDWRVFGYLAALTLLASALSGLAPALQSLKVNLSDALKGRQSLFGAAAGHGWLRGLLMVTQVAVSLVLLVGATLFVRAHRRVAAADFGYDARQVIAAEQKINDAFKVGRSWVAHHRELAERVASMPGVQSVSYARRPPFGREMMEVQSVDKADNAVRQASWNAVSPGFFATLGISIVRGRALQESDPPCEKGSCSVVVSQELARELWPDKDPLGKLLRMPGGTILEVVGVARNTSTLRIGRADDPSIYFPWNANGGPYSLLVRFTGDGAPLAQAITATIRGMARDLAVDTRTMQSRIDESLEGFWKLELLIKILGAIAVALAIIGIYGLASFAVSQRTREIGVRIALGARSQDIFRAVLGSSLRPVVAGLLVGLLLAFAAATLLARVTQFSGDMLFTVNPYDFIAYGVATALLAAVIFAALLGPARRAMKVDPMVGLRDQ